MPQERGIKEEKRIINFYGEGVLESVWQNTKLTTVRKDDPKYHGFKVLENVIGNFDGEKRDLIIWGVQASIPLKEVDPVLLALDGFLSVDQAVEDLRQYPGYENMDENSPVTLIAALDKARVPSIEISFNQFVELSGQRSGKSLSEVVRNPNLQHIIRPAIAKWFHFRGGNVEDWLNFFVKNGLMSEEKHEEIIAYSRNGQPDYFRRKILHSPATTKYLATHYFYGGWGSKPAERDYGNLYLPFVLGDLTQISKGKIK